MPDPIRVLHVLNEIDLGGGIEMWLMQLFRRISPREVTFDFLVETGLPGAFDEEIRSRGGRIIPCGYPRQFWRYGARLHHALRQFGPFNVVHSHVHVFSGLTLTIAATLGVPLRLAHSHTDRRTIDLNSSILKKAYRSGLRAALRKNMTHGFAVSDAAARDLFGTNYASDQRIRVLPCAIDYSTFQQGADRLSARSELAIPPEAKVVGHVGRFIPSKNHHHLVQAFAIAAQRNPQLHLLLVGDGNLRSSVQQFVRDNDLLSRVTFAGVRSDVPRLLAAMDAFVFPSKHEGLGLALIEAQAAGLPLVVSDTVPDEAVIAGHWVRRVPPLDATGWAASILEAVGLPRDARRPSVSQIFDIDHNLAELMAIYRSLGQARIERHTPP